MSFEPGIEQPSGLSDIPILHILITVLIVDKGAEIPVYRYLL